MTDRRLVGGERIAVVQFGFTGHRLAYVRALLDATGDSCRLALLTTEDAVRSREMAVHLGMYIGTDRLEVKTVRPAHRTMRHIMHAVSDLGADRLVLLEGDRRSLRAAFYARGHGAPANGIAVLIMRTPSLRSGGLRARLRAASKMAAVAIANALGGARLDLFFLTDSFASVVYRRGYPALRPVADPLPSFPIVDRTAARRDLNLGDQEFVVGLLGAQNATKHADLVLDAAALRSDRVHVVVAGPFDDWTARRIGAARSQGARVTDRRGYLDDADLATCLWACDAIALTYELDAPSGFLVAAQRAGIPVLAAGSPWVTAVVRDNQLGVVSQLTADSIGLAIDRLASSRLRSSAIPRGDLLLGDQTSFGDRLLARRRGD